MADQRNMMNSTVEASAHRAQARVRLGSRATAAGLAMITSLILLPIGCDGSDATGTDAGSGQKEQSEASPSATSAPAGTDGESSGSRLDQVLETRDPFERARRLGALLPELGPEAVPEVKAVLDRFRLDLNAVDFDLLVRFWANHDPRAATIWTFKRASPHYKTAAAQTVIEIWASKDPAAALVAAENALRLSDEDVARAVQMALVRGWFQADREGLERYIYGLGSGLKRQRALFAYALTLAAEEGSEAVAHWAESVSDEDGRYKMAVYRQTLAALAWGDPEAAARFCDTHCDGPFGGRLRIVLIRTRIRDGADGAEILEWVAGTGTPAETEEQIEKRQHELWVAYAQWAFRDREEAVRWMREQIESDVPPAWIKSLYGEFARQVSVDSPEEAIQWAQKIEEAAERELSLVRIARRWRRQDEAAAEAWLQQSDLPERARQSARDTSLPDNLPKRRPRDPWAEDV